MWPRRNTSAGTTRPSVNLVSIFRGGRPPVYFRYAAQAELELPLDAVDEAAAARWVDDRIVDFVRAYLSMRESDHYAQDHLVEGPVAHVRFPDFAAGATIEWQGKKYYSSAR